MEIPPKPEWDVTTRATLKRIAIASVSKVPTSPVGQTIRGVGGGTVENPEEEASDEAADAGQQPREEVAGWRPQIPLTQHSSYSKIVFKNRVVGELCKQFETVEIKRWCGFRIGVWVGILVQGMLKFPIQKKSNR